MEVTIPEDIAEHIAEDVAEDFAEVAEVEVK